MYDVKPAMRKILMDQAYLYLFKAISYEKTHAHCVKWWQMCLQKACDFELKALGYMAINRVKLIAPKHDDEALHAAYTPAPDYINFGSTMH